MGKTKNTFMEIRQLEELQYSPTFTKKESVEHGKKAALEIVNRGEITPLKALSNIARIKEFFNACYDGLKDEIELTENTTENGVTFTLSNTGDRLDYEADLVYKELKEKLKDRENLLKLARKSKDVIFDSEGVDVPKVPIKTFSKETLNLKF